MRHVDDLSLPATETKHGQISAAQLAERPNMTRDLLAALQRNPPCWSAFMRALKVSEAKEDGIEVSPGLLHPLAYCVLRQILSQKPSADVFIMALARVTREDIIAEKDMVIELPDVIQDVTANLKGFTRHAYFKEAVVGLFTMKMSLVEKVSLSFKYTHPPNGKYLAGRACHAVAVSNRMFAQHAASLDSASPQHLAGWLQSLEAFREYIPPNYRQDLGENSPAQFGTVPLKTRLKMAMMVKMMSPQASFVSLVAQGPELEPSLKLPAVMLVCITCGAFTERGSEDLKLRSKGKSMANCSYCATASYCNTECQAKHWKEEHKNLCHRYAKNRKALQTPKK